MSKQTTYAGIDYSGPGSQVNRDKETGIRYGVIASNSLADCGQEIWDNGVDESYLSFVSEVKKNLRGALSDFYSDTKWDDKPSKLDNAVEKAFDALDDIGDQYQCDDTQMSYDKDGYKIISCLTNDWMVIKSPYFTYAQFCSPCVPGACNLDSPLEEPVEANKCYCLGGDWFSDDEPAPYPIYEVATGKLVQPK